MTQWNYRDFEVLVRRRVDGVAVGRVAMTGVQSPRHMVPAAQYAMRLLAAQEGEGLYAEIRRQDQPDAAPLTVVLEG